MFYLIEISNGDSKIKGKAIYEFATQNEAIAMFHKKLGTAMSSDLYTEELVMVINSDGGVYASEHYVRVVEEIVTE